MNLSFLPGTYAICRLAPAEGVAGWMSRGPHFLSITRTADELSVVCEENLVPAGVQAERGWVALKVHGPLDFGLTGILAKLAVPLAAVAIPIFAISTFDTDYLLIKAGDKDQARRALEQGGHIFV